MTGFPAVNVPMGYSRGGLLPAGITIYGRAWSEPVLAGTLHATILSQPKFESALSYHLARLAATTEMPAALIRQTFDEALTADPAIGLAARADIVAVTERDPACTSLGVPAAISRP